MDFRLKSTKFVIVDDSHPLDWQYNVGEDKFALVISSPTDIPPMRETGGISIESWQKSNGEYYIAFLLKNPKFQEIFIQSLDNDIKLWYNTIISERRSQTL